MESQARKWVIVSYIGAAALIGFILLTFGLKLSGVFDWETKVRNVELVLRLGSIVVAAIVFFVFLRHHQINQFMTEVVVELSRVTWPTPKETVSATYVVMIMVLISGMILGLLDYLWTTLLKWVL